MTINTRKPTGLPSWPVVLLAGREKTGKSFGAALATASPLIGRALWIGIGEDDPDEYGRVPGANFDIVIHDGTKDGIVRAVEAAVAEPLVDGKPTLIIADSMTKYWELLVDNVQGIANARQNGRKTASGDYAISPDLWNVAKGWWYDLMNPLLAHQGPVILTARLEEVTVMDEGKPTKEKTWKVGGHKSLPYDVGVVIEMHERGHALITGTRSVTMALERPEPVKGGISVVDLWTRMGLTEKAATSDRVNARTVADDQSLEGVTARWRAKAQEATTEVEHVAIWKDAVNRVKANEIDPSILDMLRTEASEFKRKATPALPGTAVSPPVKREWVAEAQAFEYSEQVRELRREAEALGADEETLDLIDGVATTKPLQNPAGVPDVPLVKPDGAPDDWDRPAVLSAEDGAAAVVTPTAEPEPVPVGATGEEPF